MAEADSIRCPHCRAGLRVKKRSLIGRKVACPACRTPIVIMTPAAAAQEPAASSSALTCRCPHCRSTLKLGSRAVLGKKAPCPKCGRRFVLQEAAAAKRQSSGGRAGKRQREFDDFDEAGFDEAGYADEYAAGGDTWESRSLAETRHEDEWDDFGPPPPYRVSPPGARSSRRTAGRGRRKGRTKKKKSAPAAWVRPTLVATGCVLGLAVVTAGIVLAVSALKKSNTAHKLAAYVPEDAEFVILGRLDRLRESNSALAGQLRNQMNNPQARSAFSRPEMKRFGLGSIDDIKTLLVAGSGLEAAVGGFPNAAGGIVVAFETYKPLNIGEIRRNSESESHAGKTYYIDRVNGPGGVRWAAYLPSETTLIVGSVESLKKAIEQSADGEGPQRLRFADLNQDLAFAYVPRSGRVVPPQAQAAAGDAPPFVQKLLQAVQNDLAAVAVGLTFQSGLKIKVQGSCGSAAGAAELKEGLDEFISQGRGFLALMSAQMPGDASKAVNEILDSVRTSQDGSMVELTASVSEEALSNLQSLPGAGGNPFQPFGGRQPRFP